MSPRTASSRSSSSWPTNGPGGAGSCRGTTTGAARFPVASPVACPVASAVTFAVACAVTGAATSAVAVTGAATSAVRFAVACAVRFARAGQGRVGGEHLPVQLLGTGAGIGAQLLDQPFPQPAVVLQGVRGAPGLVQGQHVLAGDPFVQRVRGGPLGQLDHQLATLAQAQPGVGQVVLRGQPLLLQPVAFGLGPLAVDAGQQLSPPELQRQGEQPRPHDVLGPAEGLCAQVAEPVQVGPSRRVGGQGVAARRRRPRRPPVAGGSHELPVRLLLRLGERGRDGPLGPVPPRLAEPGRPGRRLHLQRQALRRVEPDEPHLVPLPALRDYQGVPLRVAAGWRGPLNEYGFDNKVSSLRPC